MNYKLVSHPGARFEWGIALWIPKSSRWIETMQFLMRMDALNALKRLNKFGHLI